MNVSYDLCFYFGVLNLLQKNLTDGELDAFMKM